MTDGFLLHSVFSATHDSNFQLLLLFVLDMGMHKSLHINEKLMYELFNSRKTHEIVFLTCPHEDSLQLESYFDYV